MNRQAHERGTAKVVRVGLKTGTAELGRVGLCKDEQSHRVPLDLKEGAVHIAAAGRNAARASVEKWKSSFTPAGGKNPEGDIQEHSRGELYDPFDQETYESVNDSFQLAQADSLEQHQRLSPGRTCRDAAPWELRRPLDLHGEGSPVDGLPKWRSYFPDKESLEPPAYGSISRALRLGDNSSGLELPARYGDERMSWPEQRSTIVSRVRLSSPRLQPDHPMVAPVEEEEEDCAPSSSMKRSKTKSVQMDQITINCDLCDIQVSNGQELEEHLESKLHWDLMAHIQLHNHYDDIIMAFLQDILLYKSIKCSPPVDDRDLPALQEKEHMTKVALFHCAACQLLLSTTKEAVQNHMRSAEHLARAKEFGAQQKHASLDRAETIMKELQPQFDDFLKGFGKLE
ncbi:DBIRD complex subunit ZNF326-like isoform X2 [Nerophis ophidion]|uniref:DBIRD complex subunit ZNF326-like isoform X2 n=1 Tax=Nerophis ophidion TaxID=159077 RepID=UPI002ADFE6B7|nr:DBIRD complex subunit ZNF326-like isoform X2 [Nerophis ophidion]